MEDTSSARRARDAPPPARSVNAESAVGRAADRSGNGRIISVDHVRDRNISELIVALRDYGPLSRADLARRLKVARATVTTIVQKCVNAGIVVDSDTERPETPGRPPQNIALSARGTEVGALAIGDDRVEFSIVDAYGRSRGQQGVPLPPSPTRAQIRRAVTRSVTQVLGEPKPDLLAVGIVVSGSCNSSNTAVVSCPAQPALEGTYLVEMVEHLTGCQAWVQEDAAAAALAQDWFAHQVRPKQDFACIKIGDNGVGVALFMSQHLLRGADGQTTEFGHLPLAREQRSCRCGLTGCWETVASAHWLADRISAGGSATQSTGELQRIPSNLFAASEPATQAIAEEYAENVSLGLAAIVNALAIDTLVLHGTISAGGPALVEAVQRATKTRVLPPRRDAVTVMLSSVSDRMPALSAAAVVYARGFGYLIRNHLQEGVDDGR